MTAECISGELRRIVWSSVTATLLIHIINRHAAVFWCFIQENRKTGPMHWQFGVWCLAQGHTGSIHPALKPRPCKLSYCRPIITELFHNLSSIICFRLYWSYFHCFLCVNIINQILRGRNINKTSCKIKAKHWILITVNCCYLAIFLRPPAARIFCTISESVLDKVQLQTFIVNPVQELNPSSVVTLFYTLRYKAMLTKLSLIRLGTKKNIGL